MSDGDFDKSRRYAIDKMNFDIVSGFYNILSLSAILHFQLISWAWHKSQEHVLFVCSHVPRSFGVTEGNEVLFSSLFTVYFALFQFFESLPWSYYRHFVIEERYGFNKQTIGFFIKDRIKSLAVGSVIGLPITSMLVWIIKAGGRYFYIYAYGFTFVVSLIIMFVYPEFIAPIFDRYERFPDCDLRKKVEELAASIEFPLKKLYVVEGSKRSSHSNAYFYGFGKNKRIVLFDTLIKGFKMPGAESESSGNADENSDETQNRGCSDDEEILATLAHELGHWKLNHVTLNLVIAQINIFFMFFAFGQLINVDQLFVDFGFPHSTAPALIRLIVVFQFIFMPYSSVLEFLLTMISRKFEFQADAFANNSSVDATGNATAKPTESSPSLRLAVACAVGSVAASVVYILVPFVSPAFRRICLPYVPATSKQLTLVAQLLRFAEAHMHRRIGKLLDVGSGDGRVVLSLLADKRLTSLTTAAGVELNRPLVWWSCLAAWRQDHSDRASFHCHDLWTFDVSPFQSVVVFGVDTMMKPLEEKLLNELSGEPVIVACRFPLPSLPHYIKLGSGPDVAYLYLPKLNGKT
ncbi:hypothetical protein TcWFU_006155 [Taenia crassiceps]|uniref:Ste24 endopeptidase n=1 Tax=Taenia crassiceps TaxID=6207 RepID=A0ABR4QN53_9CEST